MSIVYYTPDGHRLLFPSLAAFETYQSKPDVIAQITKDEGWISWDELLIVCAITIAALVIIKHYDNHKSRDTKQKIIK